jgi:spore maturation protein A
MLNYIWFGLMAVALVVAIFTGNAAAVTKASVDSARTAVEISLGLVGIMTLWLGIMRVAEQAGLVSMLSRALRPISRLLFPEIPPDHPAIGAMIMNIAANMLGLSNAATPLGIKAMEELQTLNPEKDTASNAMVTFMALNTSGIQFIPATIIGVLAAAGSKAPTVIIPTTLVATFCGAIAAVTTAKILQRFFPQRVASVASADAPAPEAGAATPEDQP